MKNNKSALVLLLYVAVSIHGALAGDKFNKSFSDICGGQRSSGATFICLENKNPSAVDIMVTNVDNFDWDGISRPDHNWNDITLNSGQMMCKRAEINCRAKNQAFNFEVSGVSTRMTMFYIGSSTVQGWAAEWKRSESTTKELDLYGGRVARAQFQGGSDAPTGYWYEGANCPDNRKNCSLFKIGSKK